MPLPPACPARLKGSTHPPLVPCKAERIHLQVTFLTASSISLNQQNPVRTHAPQRTEFQTQHVLANFAG